MKQVETTREAIINRRSVRKYKTDMIPRDIIERIVEAGTYAANGRGHQASIILAVTNKELRDRLSEMNRKIGGWDEGFDPFYGKHRTREQTAVIMCFIIIQIGTNSMTSVTDIMSCPVHQILCTSKLFESFFQPSIHFISSDFFSCI